jgi:hypothetical protein
MNEKSSQAGLVERRADLMAELFLQELGPQFVTRPTADVGFDFLIGFANRKGGVNNIAIQLKATDRSPGNRIQLERRLFERSAHSNIPNLLLVVDVKENRLYYAWLTPDQRHSNASRISVPIEEITPATKAELRRQFETADVIVAAAG